MQGATVVLGPPCWRREDLEDVRARSIAPDGHDIAPLRQGAAAWPWHCRRYRDVHDVGRLVHTLRLNGAHALLVRMTNVVELRAHLRSFPAASSAADRAAVVANLLTLSAGIREVAAEAAGLPHLAPVQLERAIQHLLDALHHLEEAADVLTDGGAWTPF